MISSGAVRDVALGLPGVEERETWGKPTFRVAGRLFLTLAADGSTATMKATPADQEVLIAADPTVFSVAAYVGRHGWVTAALDRADPDEVGELVVDAWRQRAPREPSAGEPNQARTGQQSGTSERVGGSEPVGASGAACERR